MSAPVTLHWIEDFTFRADVDAGEQLTFTSLPRDRRPGPGPSPMEGVLAAVGGCTGMDVVLILNKMKKTPASLRIEVEGTRREEHPKIYTVIALTYHMEGDALDEASVKRAVDLSQNKYCSVAAMLRPTVEFSYRIILNGTELS